MWGLDTRTRAVAQDHEDLSRRRAESVAQLLVAAGASPSQVRAQGFGEARPLFDNTTDENKQANRRVEIVIYREF